MKRNKRAQMEKIKPERTILIEKRAVKANQKISKRKKKNDSQKRQRLSQKEQYYSKRAMRANQRYQKNDSQKEAKKCPHMNIFAFDIITMLCVCTYISVHMNMKTFSLCHMMANLLFQLNCKEPF